MRLKLDLLPGELVVAQLPPEAEVPGWARGEFVSITRTRNELSVICDAAGVPEDVKTEGPWRAFVVRGPLEFWLTGVLDSVARPLAEAKIPIFAVSTFDTDYVLVASGDIEQAVRVLSEHHDVVRR